MSLACAVHKVHVPKPLRIVVCDTGHFNIHRLMGYLLRGQPLPKAGTKAERALAQQGFDAWVAAGKPGHPVFELWGPTSSG